MIKESIKTKVVILRVSETRLDFFFHFPSQFTFIWFYNRGGIIWVISEGKYLL